MKINYTGTTNFSPAQQKKLDGKFAKLSKLLDRRGEKGAHVILSTERHLHRAEITVQYYDHSLVGLHSSSDHFNSITGAIDKLEKQIIKVHNKRRDTSRTTEAKNWVPPAEQPAAKKAVPAKTAVKAKAKKAVEPLDKQVFKVNHHTKRKPMTLEEAVIEMDGGKDYMVYRDAESDKVQVLVKRGDGHFDLIEA